MAAKTQMRATAVGLAMYEMASKVKNHNRLTRHVVLNATEHGREYSVREPEWNAHLSFKTAEMLKAAEILS